MYPRPYRGTLERPVRDDPAGTRLLYPSPLAFWPCFSWDPAEPAEA